MPWRGLAKPLQWRRLPSLVETATSRPRVRHRVRDQSHNGRALIQVAMLNRLNSKSPVILKNVRCLWIDRSFRKEGWQEEP